MDRLDGGPARSTSNVGEREEPNLVEQWAEREESNLVEQWTKEKQNGFPGDAQEEFRKRSENYVNLMKKLRMDAMKSVEVEVNPEMEQDTSHTGPPAEASRLPCGAEARTLLMGASLVEDPPAVKEEITEHTTSPSTASETLVSGENFTGDVQRSTADRIFREEAMKLVKWYNNTVTDDTEENDVEIHIIDDGRGDSDSDEYSDCSSDSGRAEFWDRTSQENVTSQGEMKREPSDEEANIRENLFVNDANSVDALDIEEKTSLKRQKKRQARKARQTKRRDTRRTIPDLESSDDENNEANNYTPDTLVSCSDLPRATDEPGGGRVYDHDGSMANFKAKHQDSHPGMVYAAVSIMEEHKLQTMHLAMLMMTMINATTAIGYGTAAFMHSMKREEIEGLDRDLNMADKGAPESWTQRVRRAAKNIAHMWAVPRGFTVDSGAADHVIPFGWIRFIEMVASMGSLAGVHYIAANGHRIANMGQQTINFWTRDGVKSSLTFQVAKVNKPLCSVSKLIDDNFRIVFDRSGSYIMDKATGEVMRIKRERGVFVLEAFVGRNPCMTAKENEDFSRRE